MHHVIVMVNNKAKQQNNKQSKIEVLTQHNYRRTRMMDAAVIFRQEIYVFVFTTQLNEASCTDQCCLMVGGTLYGLWADCAFPRRFGRTFGSLLLQGLVTVLVCSQVVDSGVWPRLFTFRVNVRVMRLVAVSQADHGDLTYLQLLGAPSPGHGILQLKVFSLSGQLLPVRVHSFFP
jgi:hypothetical protein